MLRNQPANSSQRRAKDNQLFPRGLTTIHDILQGSVEDGRIVSIVGVVKDFRAPIPTRREDHKCTVTLYDPTADDDNSGIDLNVFRKESEMPDVDVGDVVLVFMAKLQNRSGTCSLLTSFRTDVHVYDARMVPKCKKAASARAALKVPTTKVNREPDAIENEYVFWIFQRVDKAFLPDQVEFLERKRQSLNVRDKFSLLQDVRDAKFADLIVQVVKEPYDLGDKMNLWVSDYTENNAFFHKTIDSAEWTHGLPAIDGDPFGYTIGRKKQVDDGAFDWSGPLGKKSMQLTCWEPHATFIRDQVRMGDWLHLRNVQICVGHNNMNLEGRLHEDRDHRDRVCVNVLDTQGDRNTVPPRLVEALRRKRDYEKELTLSHKTDNKRKAEELSKKENAKSKRQKKRENKFKAMEEEQAAKEAALGLSKIIVSEHEDKPIVALSTILTPVLYTTMIGNQEVHLELPFTCATYRTNVRVIDFHPASLTDFAVRRTPSEYEILSDNEASDSDSDLSCASSHVSRGLVNKRHVWEWSFALKLEEVSTSPNTKAPARTWAVVNNYDAQLLLGFDATDLHAPRNDADEAAVNVETLRNRLWDLWGNLEERKSKLEAKRRQHAKDPFNEPPVDSSDVEDNGAPRGLVDKGAEDVPGSQLTNRPFTCCLKQYGVKVKAKAGEVETAGEGKRWQRVFGLFGTKIKG